MTSSGRWKKAVDENIEIPLNGGVAKFALNRENSIQLLAASGRPHRQVEPGMYFRQLGTSDESTALRGGVPLNDLKETTLDKLGWLRLEDGRWGVRKGLVKLTQSQHINVQDCKAQKYTSTFNAEQYVLHADSGEEGMWRTS